MPLLISFVFALLTAFISAETLTIVANERASSSSQPVFSVETITLEEGDTAAALYLSNLAYLDVVINGIIVRIDANDPTQQNLPVIAGPATIRVVNYSNLNAALATIRIKRGSDPAVSTPTQAVVIPDDGSGDREVRLESSTDMVTWAATQPGLFTTGQTARFFRVRLVKVPVN